jgi:hypothetical protein
MSRIPLLTTCVNREYLVVNVLVTLKLIHEIKRGSVMHLFLIRPWSQP